MMVVQATFYHGLDGVYHNREYLIKDRKVFSTDFTSVDELLSYLRTRCISANVYGYLSGKKIKLASIKNKIITKTKKFILLEGNKK